MKAITIKQPWANLIVMGLKDVENRTWSTNYRGRVLVHASSIPNIDALCDWEEKLGIVPKCAIVGSVEIIDCVLNHPSKWAIEGHWHWVLANPIMYKKPIKGIRGKLSFWNYDGELLEELANSSHR